MLTDIIRGIVSGVMGVVNNKLTTKANVSEITRIDSELADKATLANLMALETQVTAITDLAPQDLNTLAEIAARVNSDADLVTVEIANREAAVATEAAARIAADEALDNRIDALEASSASGATIADVNAVVSTVMGDEISQRLAGDAALDARVSSVESAVSSEGTINTRITSLETAIQSTVTVSTVGAAINGALETEATVRAAADADLQTQINGVLAAVNHLVLTGTTLEGLSGQALFDAVAALAASEANPT
jgi:hypothetical protein